MKDIHKLGLRGRLPTFIESFHADRTMQVRVGSTLSDLYDQEQGVPQGGVLSTTLFNIKIPGESLPPCRGLWGTLHTRDDIDCNTCLLWEC